MNIRQLILRNFRRYESATFLFNSRFTIIIGNNGTGKTTILDALAIMLNTYFQGSGITTAGGTIKKEDARFIVTEKEGQVFREPQSEVYLQVNANMGDDDLDWIRAIGDRGGQAKNIITIGSNDRELIQKGETKDLPLMLYYGAGRLWNIHKDIKTSGPSSQLDAYRYALDPKSDQNAFEEWFKRLSLASIQKGQEFPALSVVKEVVLHCVPGALNFYFDTLENQIIIQLEEEGHLPFNCLSDGYRNMLAMVADIAHRASKLNPHHGAEVAKKTKGVILIDEIDLHLHPKWQRHVVSDLKLAFPEMQFIATTHSPFILQSLEPGEVIDLGQQPLNPEQVAQSSPDVASPGPGHEFSHRSLEDIVEEVMGIDIPQRSQRYQAMYEAAQDYYRILQESKTADEAQKEQLKQKLDELSAPYSDNVSYHAFLEMERMAAGLGKPDNDGEK